MAASGHRQTAPRPIPSRIFGVTRALGRRAALTTLTALTAFTAFTALTAATPARSTAPLLLDQDRGVQASTLASQSGDAERRQLAGEATDFQPFEARVDPAAQTLGADSLASAWLDTRLSGSLLLARGASAAAITSAFGDARADGEADAYFEVVFLASADEPYFLGGVFGGLDAAASSGTAFAGAELVDLDSGVILARAEALPDPHRFEQSGGLQAGTTYRFRAFSVASARAEPSAAPDDAGESADFGFVLALPEPATGLGAGVAALGLSAASQARAQRRRRRGRESAR